MKDEFIVSLLNKHPIKQIEPVKNPFNYLVKSIVYQQLSTKAVGTIYGRLINLFQNQNIIIGGLSILPCSQKWKGYRSMVARLFWTSIG